MEIEVSAEAKDKALNRRVAITVVVLSVFAGLCNIKDGNVVQAMEQAQAALLDKWNEYQAARTKQHLEETTRATLSVLADPRRAAPALAQVDANIARYKGEAPGLARDARAQSDLYNELNMHDDQFDAGDAALTTAISIAAVTALTESSLLMWVSWAFGAFGIFMGLCGFLKLPFHPDVLATILG